MDLYIQHVADAYKRGFVPLSWDDFRHDGAYLTIASMIYDEEAANARFQLRIAWHLREQERQWEAELAKHANDLPELGDKGDVGDFVKGLVKGIWAGSLDQIKSVYNMLRHPVDTIKGFFKFLGDLFNHVKDGDFSEALKQLFPELHELVTQWGTLSQERRGELIGRVLAKEAPKVLMAGGVGGILATILNKIKSKLVGKLAKVKIPTAVLQAAKRLGVDLEKVQIVNGVATFTIGTAATLTKADLRAVAEFLKQAGAKSVRIQAAVQHPQLLAMLLDPRKRKLLLGKDVQVKIIQQVEIGGKFEALIEITGDL